MLNMTMQEFRSLCKRDFRMALNTLEDYIDELHSEEDMKIMAKRAIDNNEPLLAAHICKGIYEEGASPDAWYKWDKTAGTMCSIRGINDGQELYEAFVDYCKDFSAKNEAPWYFDSDESEFLCPFDGDKTDDCADCAYGGDFHFDTKTGESVRR